MSFAVDHRLDVGPDLRARVASIASTPAEADYHFLLDVIDAATLARASMLAAEWGVQPHDVLIANGWLDPDDYYRALAGACGTAFKEALSPADAVPAAKTTPRQCLSTGLLKERSQQRRFVLAPERLRPTALRTMLAQLAPHDFALASPRAVREAICHHFASHLSWGAVEALAVRRPEQSARNATARWQALGLAFGATGLILALLLAPMEAIRIATLLLGVLFLPVIGLRAVAAYGLRRPMTMTALPHRDRDTALPVYSIFVPLYREAHMLPPLLNALSASIGRPPSSTSS